MSTILQKTDGGDHRESDSATEVNPVTSLINRIETLMERAFAIPGLSEAERLYKAKNLNIQLAELGMKSGAVRLKSWPLSVELPVAGKCNLRCTMCGLSHGNPQFPNWTLEEVARFSEFYKFGVMANPTGAGEPLTNKDFFKILELFGSYGLRIAFYSNATLLTTEKAGRLVDIGVEQYNVSIDGATKETFERVRKYAKFETVVGNVKNLIKIRNERKKKLPRVQIAMVLMRDTMHELPDLVKLAASLKADSVYTMFESGWLPDQSPLHEPSRTNAVLREARLMANSLGISLNAPSDIPEFAEPPVEGSKVEDVKPSKPCMCSHPWTQLVVANDGGVGPCCRITGFLEGRALGNIKDESPRLLWNSPGMVWLRERLVLGDAPDICRNCSIRTLRIT